MPDCGFRDRSKPYGLARLGSGRNSSRCRFERRHPRNPSLQSDCWLVNRVRNSIVGFVRPAGCRLIGYRIGGHSSSSRTDSHKYQHMDRALLRRSGWAGAGGLEVRQGLKASACFVERRGVVGSEIVRLSSLLGFRISPDANFLHSPQLQGLIQMAPLTGWRYLQTARIAGGRLPWQIVVQARDHETEAMTANPRAHCLLLAVVQVMEEALVTRPAVAVSPRDSVAAERYFCRSRILSSRAASGRLPPILANFVFSYPAPATTIMPQPL